MICVKCQQLVNKALSAEVLENVMNAMNDEDDDNETTGNSSFQGW